MTNFWFELGYVAALMALTLGAGWAVGLCRRLVQQDETR